MIGDLHENSGHKNSRGKDHRAGRVRRPPGLVHGDLVPAQYEALHFNSMQDNESFTAKKGTLRGIHFQQDPMAQAKIVRVVRAPLMDVAVDLRKGSPTYLQVVSVELSAENKRQFYIPRGFGHGLRDPDGRRGLLL